MPAIGDITINDATPTAVVFTPRKADPENSIWVKRGYNSSNTFAAADSLLSLGVSPASSSRPTTRVKAEVAFPNPSYATTDENPISTARAYLTVVIPDDFSQANRDHFEALLQNFVADGVMTSAIADGEGSY